MVSVDVFFQDRIGRPVFALAPSHVFPLAVVVLFQKYYFKNGFSGGRGWLLWG